jgi:hypothetical protein
MGERDGARKSNVLTSGRNVANPKSGSDYSVLITKYFFFFSNFTYLVRCFRISHKMSSCTPRSYAYTRLKTTVIEEVITI